MFTDVQKQIDCWFLYVVAVLTDITQIL